VQTSAPRTPRQQARIEAIARIKAIARRQIGHGGAGALSLREIAKEMGLVSSAVYRYVPSREALLTELIADAYDRLGAIAEAADAAVDPDDAAGRWRAAAGALRSWALAHPTDHTLVFGPPVPGYDAPEQTFAPAQRWIEILLEVLRRAAPRDLPAPAPDLVESLTAFRDARVPGVPLPVVAAGLRAWAQLHGLVALEVYGQTNFVLGTPAALFHDCIEHQVTQLGLDS